MEFLTQFIVVVGLLTLCVNVITEVLKKTFGWKKEIPTQIICLIVSILLSVMAMVVFCQINAIAILWYFWVGAIVLGFFTSYAAMFGFDTLKELISKYIK